MRVTPSVVSDGTDSSSPAASGQRPSDLVLLIEDDEMIAGLIGRVFSKLGKRVLIAGSGAEGAQLYAENEKQIELVMLDCCLPDVDGAALCRVFRRLSPSLPMILTSGWDHGVAQTLAEKGPTVFLPKPFTSAQVEALVSSMVGTTT